MLLPVKRDEAAHQIGFAAGDEAHHRLHFLERQEGRFVAIVKDIGLLFDRHDIGMAADHPERLHPLRLCHSERHFGANGAECFVNRIAGSIGPRVDYGLGQIGWNVHGLGPVLMRVSYI